MAEATATHRMSDAVKVGVIGCGGIAQAVHLRILMALPGVEVAALAECDERRLEEAAHQAPHAARFTDCAELLALPDLQAVIICLSTSFHASVAIAAMRAGKHVYLEKPMATSLDEAQGVLEAWQATRVIGMMGFNYRFNPLCRALREHVASGRSGKVVAVRSLFTTARHNMPAWKRSRRSGGGALLALGSHDIDLVRFILGQEVAEVFAHVQSIHSEADVATIQMRMADGVQVQSIVALCANEQATVEVFGDAGKVVMDRYQWPTTRVSGPRAGGLRRQLCDDLMAIRGVPYLLRKLRAPLQEPSFAAALAHFIEAVRTVCSTNGPDRVSPDFMDGYRSLAVVEAAERSAHTGSIVAPRDSADRCPEAPGVTHTAGGT